MAPHAPSKDIPDGRQIAWRIIRPTPKSVGLMAFLADGGVSAPLSRPKGDGPAKNHGRNPPSASSRKAVLFASSHSLVFQLRSSKFRKAGQGGIASEALYVEHETGGQQPCIGGRSNLVVELRRRMASRIRMKDRARLLRRPAVPRIRSRRIRPRSLRTSIALIGVVSRDTSRRVSELGRRSPRKSPRPPSPSSPPHPILAS